MWFFVCPLLCNNGNGAWYCWIRTDNYLNITPRTLTGNAACGLCKTCTYTTINDWDKPARYLTFTFVVWTLIAFDRVWFVVNRSFTNVQTKGLDSSTFTPSTTYIGCMYTQTGECCTCRLFSEARMNKFVCLGASQCIQVIFDVTCLGSYEKNSSPYKPISGTEISWTDKLLRFLKSVWAQGLCWNYAYTMLQL